MAVTFVLKDDDNNKLKDYILQSSNKILDLKLMIVKDYYGDKGSVSIHLLLERTKRVFGKFNLEPGLLPNSFDTRLVDEFALREGDVIDIRVKHINEEIKQKSAEKNTENKSRGKYIPPHKKKYSKKSNNSKFNNKNSNKKSFVYRSEDFPSL